MNTAFVDENESTDNDDKNKLDSTAARKKLVNLSGIEFDTDAKEKELRRNEEDLRILNEPVTPKEIVLSKKSQKKINSIKSSVENKCQELTDFVISKSDNQSFEKLRVYSINRLASIKSRQKVQLTKLIEGSKPKKSPSKKEKEEPQTLEKQPKRNEPKLEFEELTNMKSSLTVTNPKKSQKKLEKEKQLKEIEEKVNERTVMNESINKYLNNLNKMV